MVKKWLFIFIFLSMLLFLKTPTTHAAEPIKIELTPMACSPVGAGCPDGFADLYSSYNTLHPDEPPQSCAASLTDFLTDPKSKHFFAEDPQITAQGKADERAREFIYWVLHKNSVDNHPVLKKIWNTTSSMASIFMVIIAAIMGLGFIVAQRANFQLNIKIWPYVTKLALALLYIFFSWIIVLSLIQISEWIMKLFIDNLGGNNLFNIYYSTDSGSNEKSYTTFVGCRDLNIRVQEAGDTETLIFKVTNFTYYLMGVMLLLRKILLWFLLFVSPFLAVLFPFVFIRNIGWIWIGVFFQWLFYGPLFALFIGALNKMWQAGIPFAFDFSRAGKVAGYVYPTALNVVYGGPAQRDALKISLLNNGNYIDTFAEYIITLIMLWAVIFFPWWLMRIFRDYCCDGIYAMKNILLSMYDQMRGGSNPSKPPSPIQPRFTTDLNTNTNSPNTVTIPIKIKLETIEEIKQTKTSDISRSLNLAASHLADIARFETDKNTQESVKRSLNFLSNPTRAETPTERQKYMNIRTELFNRAIKDDKDARQLLSATSNSTAERIQKRNEIIKTTPLATPIMDVVSNRVQLSKDKVSSINNSLVGSISDNNDVVNTIAEATKVPAPKVHAILSSFRGQTSQLSSNTIDNISKDTGIEKPKVTDVIQYISNVVRKNKDLVKKVAQQEGINESQLEQMVATQIPAVTHPESSIDQMITMPPTVSIEDYEEVKKMWTQQYEKGEVPTSENLKTREEWVNQDIVFISNTLNKLMAPEDKLRQEGVDEVGYILPIFIINNLRGDELLVYLKAKLEAAKKVKEDIEKEKDITEKVKSEDKKKDEELVDVDRPKSEDAKNDQHMTEEMKEEDTDGNETPDPKENAPSEEAVDTTPQVDVEVNQGTPTENPSEQAMPIPESQKDNSNSGDGTSENNPPLI